MVNFIIYKANGKITRIGYCQNGYIQLQPQDTSETVIEGICDLNTDYILSGTVTTRPTQLTTLDKSILTANGVDVITITNAPTGTFTATNTTTRETVSGSISGSDTFSTTVAGTYEIKIESFPYLDFVTTVEAI